MLAGSSPGILVDPYHCDALHSGSSLLRHSLATGTTHSDAACEAETANVRGMASGRRGAQEVASSSCASWTRPRRRALRLHERGWWQEPCALRRARGVARGLGASLAGVVVRVSWARSVRRREGRASPIRKQKLGNAMAGNAISPEWSAPRGMARGRGCLVDWRQPSGPLMTRCRVTGRLSKESCLHGCQSL